MLILNYAHPMTPAMLEQASALLGSETTERRIPTQIDRSQPIALEMARIIDASGMSAYQWQTEVFVVIPPGLAIAALCLISELHGRCGYFVSVLNITPKPNSTPPEYMITSIENLQTIREKARTKRLEK